MGLLLIQLGQGNIVYDWLSLSTDILWVQNSHWCSPVLLIWSLYAPCQHLQKQKKKQERECLGRVTLAPFVQIRPGEIYIVNIHNYSYKTNGKLTYAHCNDHLLTSKTHWCIHTSGYWPQWCFYKCIHIIQSSEAVCLIWPVLTLTVGWSENKGFLYSNHFQLEVTGTGREQGSLVGLVGGNEIGKEERKWWNAEKTVQWWNEWCKRTEVDFWFYF